MLPIFLFFYLHIYLHISIYMVINRIACLLTFLFICLLEQIKSQYSDKWQFQLHVTSYPQISGFYSCHTRAHLTFICRQASPAGAIGVMQHSKVNQCNIRQAPIMRLTHGVCAHSACECHETQRERGSEWRLPPTLTSLTPHIKVQTTHGEGLLLSWGGEKILLKAGNFQQRS